MDSIDALAAAEPVLHGHTGMPRESGVADPPALLLTGSRRESAIALAMPAGGRANELSCRCFDLAVGSLLLLLLLPLMGICALVVRLSGAGPVLFRHTRVGRDGREFQCLKFRTMVQNADALFEELLESNTDALHEWLTAQKLQKDPRVTFCGHFLRRYCLDELPQLFNVMAGDMSIVGPRPIVTAEIGRYGAAFADYCSVKPGLTGLWQVSGRHRLPYEHRVQLDAEYAQSKSVAGDVVILWRTVPVVLLGLNQ
jgi:lipopolysaccharide/colanic/teichoic acid biosynthesis glycosyltransferase